MSDARRRVLVLGGRITGDLPVASILSSTFDVDEFETLEAAMEALRTREYHAVFADVGDFLPLERDLVSQQSSMLLEHIGEGLCIVDREGHCRWSNGRMRQFPPEVTERVKQFCQQARSMFQSKSWQASATAHGASPRSPVADAHGAKTRKFSFQTTVGRYYEVIASPVLDDRGEVSQVAAIVIDATSGKRLQEKIDAIDAAGRELARIENEAVARLSPKDRLELLRDKIIAFSKKLMHFDHFAIRLVDSRTNKLEVVIAEGLPEEAVDIDLYPQPEGNGISGYVAATGRSYICHDTEKDPRYVLGMEHCKSSLTVPLRLNDAVIGVFNVESENVGQFDEDDRQFAEIFGRYVAMALHVLDLLVIERCTTAGELTSSVAEELSQPINEIISEAQALMEEYIGDDNMRLRLQRLSDKADGVRQIVDQVAAGPQQAIFGSRASDDAPPRFPGKRVLIADDEANIRQTIANILTREGCRCTVCRDGYEAIMILEQTTFDLVVSDIRMPHRNGYEIFASARRQDETLPVLLMTGFGYDPHHSIVRASQEGLSSVLFKPFRVEQLLDEVAKAFGMDSPVDGASGPSASRPDDAPASL